MRVLFVSYGAGHISMCLPVIRVLRELIPAVDIRLLALTTAYGVARRAGENALGYHDYADGVDGECALRWGEQLLAQTQPHPEVSRMESLAYLGFNFLELVASSGENKAWQLWRDQGRNAFMPVRFMTRLLEKIRPDVLVTTNAPRSEEAAIRAATTIGIPSLSMVDLFALPADRYLSRIVHATRIAVLCETTRQNLIDAGVDPIRVFVTGNPAFDSLAMSEAREQGQAWRRYKGWETSHVVLWAGHKEAADTKPTKWAGIGFGQAIQDRLINWVSSRNNVCLAVRYHPNEWHDFKRPPTHPRLHWSQPEDEALIPVLMGSNQVVVQVSTVGVQAYIAGKRVISLGFSPMVIKSGLNYADVGMASNVGSIDFLTAELDRYVNAVPQVDTQHLLNVNASAALQVACHIKALYSNDDSHDL